MVSEETLDWPDVDIATSLNDDQMVAYKLIMHSLLKYTEQQNDFEPLCMVVTGTAGTGISF